MLETDFRIITHTLRVEIAIIVFSVRLSPKLRFQCSNMQLCLFVNYNIICTIIIVEQQTKRQLNINVLKPLFKQFH